jgi:hypothetical protein
MQTNAYFSILGRIMGHLQKEGRNMKRQIKQRKDRRGMVTLSSVIAYVINNLLLPLGLLRNRIGIAE